MAITSKTQLQTDITASTFTAPQKTILGNIVDSYEDIFPQLDTTQRNALTPTNGLVVYNTDEDTYQYWNGVSWADMASINSPMTIKTDWSAAELRQSHSVAKILLAAAGAGFSYAPISVMWRYTYGTVAFDFAGDLYLIFNTKTSAEKFFGIDLTVGSSTSGVYGCTSDATKNSLLENQNITLKAPTSNATVGDGVLSIWLTYSLITW